MKKKLLFAMLLVLAFTLAFAITASAKDVNLGITDINGQPIIVPTVDSDGDSLTWYYLTEEPTEGNYYTYTSGNETRYIVSVKTKAAAYVTDDTYRLAYSYPGLKAGAWNSGNIIAMNLAGVTHANGTGPKMLNFICEGSSIAYVNFSASIEKLTGMNNGVQEKNIFYGCGSLVGVDFEPGSRIKTIPSITFYRCVKLTSMVLPENLETIEFNAFAGISYLDLYVPKSVTSFAQAGTSLTIHFTGTSEVESNANWYYKPNDYVSHCDVYYSGAHKAGETVGYETNCSRCGALVHCENPEHNLSLEISYESYLENGKKIVKCLDCKTEAKECVALPLITVRGFSTPVKEGRKGITFGYSLNLSAISDYEKANNAVVSCGILLAGSEKFEDGSKIIDITLTSKYSAIDVKIDFGAEVDYDDCDLIIAGSITVASDNSNTTKYFQPSVEIETTSYTSSSYGTLFGISYNDIIGA